MTIVDNYFPFDTGPGATATAARWRLMARLWSGSGVIPGYLNALAPSISGSVVTLATGGVWIDGYYGEADSPKTVGVSGNGMVVARMDPTARQILFVFVSGQTVPTQNLTGIFEIPLMQVTGATGVDIRQYAVAAAYTIPSGVIWDTGASTIPPGWLACNGASYLRTTYPTLFNAIGTAWGSVDGTHFNVPDLRGRVTVGAGGASPNIVLAVGAKGGTTVISAANLPPHGHTASGTTASGNATHAHHPGSGYEFVIGQIPSSTLYLTTAGGSPVTYDPIGTDTQNAPHSHSFSVTTGNGPGTSAAYLPPSAGVTKMIKI